MLFRQLIDWSLLGLSNVQSISLHVPGRRRWRDQRQERFQYDTAFVAIWMHSTRGKSPRLTVRCQDGGRWISGWCKHHIHTLVYLKGANSLSFWRELPKAAAQQRRQRGENWT